MIRLLRDFDKDALLEPINAELHDEDQRLEKKDVTQFMCVMTNSAMKPLENHKHNQ